MRITEQASLGIVALCWGSFPARLYHTRWWSPDPLQRANSASLGVIALTMTVFHPPVYRAIDHLTHVPNFSRLLGNCLGVVAAWLFQPVVAQLGHAHGSRRGVLGSGRLTVAVVVALGVLFSRAALPVSAPLDFQARYGAEPAIAAYRLVLMAYLGLVVARIFALSRGNGAIIRAVPQPYLRLQFRIETVGWALGAGYAAVECGTIALRLLGLAPAHTYPTVLAYDLFIAGLFTVLSGGVFGLYQRASQHVAYRRLSPLWRDLYRATPTIALTLPPVSFTDTPFPRTPEARLYRRAMEIRDGIDALRQQVTDDIHARARIWCRARGIPSDAERPTVEALAIAAALAALHCGWAAIRPVGPRPPAIAADLDAEVRDLVPVARAYRRVAGAGEGLLRADEMRPMTDDERWLRPPPLPPTPREGTRRRIARLITEVGAPAPLALVTLTVVAWDTAASTGAAARWALLAALFAPIVPWLHLERQVRRGKVTDRHVRLRAQRRGFFFFTLACGALALAALVLLGAPRAMLGLICAGIAGLLVAFAISLVWKISLHTGVAAGIVVVLAELFGWPLLALALGVVGIGWARVELGDHTRAQVIAGALIGAAVSGVAFAAVIAL